MSKASTEFERYELERFLDAERDKAEYWREYLDLKSSTDVEAELQPRIFKSTDEPPQLRNQKRAAKDFWQKLYAESLRNEPFNTSLLAISTVSTALVTAVTGFLVFRFLSPLSGAFCIFVAVTAVAGTGFGLTAHIRKKEVAERVNEMFDGRFKSYWESILEQHAVEQAKYKQDQLRKQALWNNREKERIGALKALVTGDPKAVKSRLKMSLAEFELAKIDFQVVGENGLISMSLQVPALKDVINSKTKTISEKTGNLITKSKSKEEKIEEYEVFLAGTALRVIATIFNDLPYCKQMQIAFFSEGSTRKIFHLGGELRRQQFPRFSWKTVDPVKTLRRLNLRVEGGQAKKLTTTPAWLAQLESVRIGVASKRK